MPLVKVVSVLIPLRWRRRGHRNRLQEENMKQLEMKLTLVYSKRDALKEEIVKKLVRGEIPSREFRIWLDEGGRIENQFHMLKAQTEGSVLDVSISAQKLKRLTRMLEYEIVKHLEASPFNHSPWSKVRRSRSLRVKLQAIRDEKKAEQYV